VPKDIEPAKDMFTYMSSN